MASLKILRKHMPQIKDVDKFIDFVKERGVSCTQTTLPPETLTPRQKDYNINKIIDIHKDKLATGDLIDMSDIPVVVANGNDILDGHHRYAASILNHKPEIKVAKFNTSFANLFKLGHQFADR